MIASVFSLKLCKKEKEITRMYISAVAFDFIPVVENIQ